MYSFIVSLTSLFPSAQETSPLVEGDSQVPFVRGLVEVDRACRFVMGCEDARLLESSSLHKDPTLYATMVNLEPANIEAFLHGSADEYLQEIRRAVAESESGARIIEGVYEVSRNPEAGVFSHQPLDAPSNRESLYESPDVRLRYSRISESMTVLGPGEEMLRYDLDLPFFPLMIGAAAEDQLAALEWEGSELVASATCGELTVFRAHLEDEGALTILADTLGRPRYGHSYNARGYVVMAAIDYAASDSWVPSEGTHVVQTVTDSLSVRRFVVADYTEAVADTDYRIHVPLGTRVAGSRGSGTYYGKNPERWPSEIREAVVVDGLASDAQPPSSATGSERPTDGEDPPSEGKQTVPASWLFAAVGVVLACLALGLRRRDARTG